MPVLKIAATKSGTPRKTSKPSNDRQFVTALARGLQILSCFSATQPQLSGSEIAMLTGLPQPTVWRLCHTMLALGMLISISGDKMRPGLPILRLGHSALAGINALELARPHMQDLADRYGGACGLAARDGLDMVFLERCESSSQLVLNLRRGSTVPVANSAFGWAYLAGLPIDAREKLITEIQSNEPKQWTLVSEHFEKALAGFEIQGFILNEGVFHHSYNTVAAPVFGADGKVVFCLNCGTASATLSVTALRKEVAPKLVSLARMLESVTGP